MFKHGQQAHSAQYWFQQNSLQKEAVKLTNACSDLAVTSQEHDLELAELSQLLERIKGAVGSKSLQSNESLMQAEV